MSTTQLPRYEHRTRCRPIIDESVADAEYFSSPTRPTRSADKMKVFVQFLVLACFLADVNAAPALVPNPTVTLASGIVIGTVAPVFSAPTSTATVYNYLGIPFAAPPTGTLRFAPPATPTAWSTPLQATTFPPACLQQFNCKLHSVILLESRWINIVIDPANQAAFNKYAFNNPGGGPPPPESEDCLYLNIFAPLSASPTNLKSVMFWIYGVSC